ncbi:MAG: biotin/lipoyl-containing protein [Bacteroidales bacterium]
MKNFKFIINGNEYHVDLKGIEDNIAHIEVNGTRYDVEIERKVKQTKTPRLVRPVVSGPPKPEIDKKDRGDSTAVVAPLPGNILDILVNPGDIIKKGQKLLIMEAMKMENQILAEKDGVVESIKVQKGQAVLQGDVLIEII